MSRFLFVATFILGAISIMWMGAAFVGTDTLALSLTLLIAVVYAIGYFELLQFRQATSTLERALESVSDNQDKDGSSPGNALDKWLDKLHPSLQNAARARIEGERVGLPAPVITPYLVGLLVMLGLLGTFLGMVDTLQGAVIALEGTTELEAIRTGLAAPIRGLGLAFGTSVAGVAASAMLGLSSTVSRRDRMLATRLLDTHIATNFREFSLYYNRQATYSALQVQANALPEVVDRLQQLAVQIENMSQHLGATLTSNQDNFHESMQSTYIELAGSVDKSLRESITQSAHLVAESGRLAGESIKPVIKDMMVEISSETAKTHQQLSGAVDAQLKNMGEHLGATTTEVTAAWKQGLAAHEDSNSKLINVMNASFHDISAQFEDASSALLKSFDSSVSSWSTRQQTDDQQRLSLWADSFSQAQGHAFEQLTDVSKSFTAELKQLTEIQQESFTTRTQDFESISTNLTSQWQKAGEQSIAQQQAVSLALQESSKQITEQTESSSASVVDRMNELLNTSEQLVAARVASEESWLESHALRMDKLSSVLKTELEALRDAETERGQAAVDRLAELESTVSIHLATLGKELEDPMARLIQTASETPRAAAEVIGQLRLEISNNIERDNSLLEERGRIMTELNTLSGALQQATTGQREAVESLVTSSASLLQDVGSRLTDSVGSEVTKISAITEALASSTNEMTDNFSVSAIEMSSLGEAFTLAVKLFNESNSELIENLNRIEKSLDDSTTRSDEQLGYYVAQARDIIDHSMLSQKEIFEEIRQLSRQNRQLDNTLVAELS
ncbi:MAG: DUF802 domain-containing protein [Pseudomonadales bacterium]